jgi:hypothetical protein
MAAKIGFDTAGNIENLTLVLAYRSGEKIATFSNVSELIFSESLGNPPEFSFKVTKSLSSSYWDEIKDFRLMWVAEWDDWYEIYVDLNESTSIIKSISARHLPESELSQLNLYGVNINTEEDIEREDYEKTVFYDPDNPEISLINRVLSKAVNYTVRPDVPISLRNIQKTWTFSFDNDSIYDALLEIAEEVNCLFDFRSYTMDGKIVREVGVYDLESYCKDCGHRSEFHNICPECGSTNIDEGFGDDTPVFWSIDNACDDITYSTDVDSVKNCFRLEAGDDIITSAIISCNPNGSNYIWYFSPEIRETELSKELKERLDTYDNLYNNYVNDTEYQDDILIDDFNSLVSKYLDNKDSYGEEIWIAPNSEVIPIPIKGYSSLINAMYNAIDMEYYLQSELLPYAEKTLDVTSVSEQMENLKKEITSVAVNGTVSDVTASNAVLSMAKVIIDSRYSVKVSDGKVSNNVWTGDYTVTCISDKSLTLTESVTVNINTDYEAFVQDKIKKVLAKSDDTNYDITGLFAIDNLSDFSEELKKYSKTALEGIYNCCEGVLSVLTDMGVATDTTKKDLKELIYDDYYNKSELINNELAEREKEITIVSDLLDRIDSKCAEVQKALNFEKFIQDGESGTELWKELSSFRREDTYSNSNYISDGLTNSEIISRAKEFISIANKEIIKSATLQHSISTTLKNIFTIKEFRPMLDYFKIGNWIRICVDEKVYKLRLISYELNFEDYEKTSVDFSDVTVIGSDMTDIESVINNSKKMATSYSAVERQASKGEESYSITDGWTTRGLDTTLTKIMNDSSNQTQTWNENGMLFRKKKDFLDEYEPEQMKIINSTIAITKDNWKTISTAIGKVYYEDPETKEITEVYGVNAEVLIGKLILGENIRIQNSSGSLIFDKEGFLVKDSNNNERFTIDSQGNININPNTLIIDATATGDGTIDIKSDTFSIDSTTGLGRIAGWNINATSIYKGNSTFGAAGNGNMYLGDSGISISNTFKVDANGAINATSGKIGCWNITGSSMYNNTNSAGYTGVNAYGSGMAFWAGGTDITGNNADFRVDHKGALVANNANVKGAITATSVKLAETVYIRNDVLETRTSDGYAQIIHTNPAGRSLNIGLAYDTVSFPEIVVSGIWSNSDIDCVSTINANNYRLNGIDCYNRVISAPPPNDTIHYYNWRCTENGNFNPYCNVDGNYNVESGGELNIGNNAAYIKNLFYGGELTKKSDRRDKNSLGELSKEEALAILSDAKIHKFTYKADKMQKINYGVYAQDLRDTLINTGIGHISMLGINIDGSDGEQTKNLLTPEDEVRYSVDYTQYAPLLVSGWQYHEENIHNLISRVECLEKENKELKEKLEEIREVSPYENN